MNWRDKCGKIFEQLNAFPSDVCCRLIQKIGKRDIMGAIKKAPALRLNGDINFEKNSGNGGDMKLEGASGNGDRYNI